jgi:hypothetical protein
MVRRSTVSGVQAGLVPLALVAALTAPTTAWAAGTGSKKACAASYSSYKTGAEREKAGLLSEARALYAQCVADEACPGLQPKCKAARDRVERHMPTIIPVVMDESGALTDLVVKVDGETVASHLDGRALPVEVGPHEMTFSTSNGVVATAKIIVIEGAKDREIDVYVGGARPPSRQPFELVAKPEPATAAAKGSGTEAPAGNAEAARPAEPTTPEGTSSAVDGTRSPWAMPTSPLPYIVGGIGLLGVAAGTLLTVWGVEDNNALSQCTPSCPHSSVDHIRTLYTGADIAFGVSVAALGVSTVLFSISHKTEKVSPPPVSVGVAPSRSGAVASFGGSF